MNNLKKSINLSLFQHNKVFKKTFSKIFINKLIVASGIVSKALVNNKAILWCGNGGSASDSMHLSAELVGRFKKKRKSLKSISLTSDPALLTCVSNDFGYSNVFSRQIEGLGTKGDVLIAITTSGNSRNILRQLNKRKKRLNVISFLGNNGGMCRGKSDLDMIIKSKSTARIQEMHILLGHLCVS